MDFDTIFAPPYLFVYQTYLEREIGRLGELRKIAWG